MGKYDPLHEHLKSLAPEVREVTWTFAQIEEILGAELPPSAHGHRAWWANSGSPKQHSYAQAWLAAGWKVDTVNLDEQWARFCRTELPPRAPEVEVDEDQELNVWAGRGLGRRFQEKAAELISRLSRSEFLLDHPLPVGRPPKPHEFDLVSADGRYIGECKAIGWTVSGNVPGAKMSYVNEAVYFLSFLPPETIRFVVMKKDYHPVRDETLAEYYFKTYRHLLRGVLVLEIDVDDDTVRRIGET